jgi:hemerythrin-like domain-containing protein
MSDILTALARDHIELRRLFGRLTRAKASRLRTRLLRQGREALELHHSVEEEILYPAFRRAARGHKDATMYFEALGEHDTLRCALAALLRSAPASDAFAGRAKVLEELLEHHLDEEEDDVFPRARTLLTRAARLTLGQRMAERTRRGRRAG